MASPTKAERDAVAAQAAATTASLGLPKVGRPIPTADDAMDAIAAGDAGALAQYLTLHAPPDPEVIRRLVVALVGTGETGSRLLFARRQRGRPRKNPLAQAFDDHEIIQDFDQQVRGHKARKATGDTPRGTKNKARDSVARAKQIKPRAVKEARSRVSRRRPK